MDVQILRSYLVSLGFDLDSSSLAKFKGALKDADKLVSDHVGQVGKLFLGLTTGIAAAYASVATATAALMDHVAESDLGFQLFAMKMYMSVDAAKKLKIATDALGYSLDEIAWNPELRARYMQLVADQTTMQHGLGPDYEKSLREIRDIRFEFTRMGVELQYLLMGVVKNLSKAFGLDEGGMLRELRDFNSYIQDNLPKISGAIANDLVPVMRDVKTLSEDIGLAFIHLVGSLYNDKKLQQSKGSLDDVATAIGHIGDSIDHALQKVDGFVKWLDAHPKVAAMLFGGWAGASVVGPAGAGIGLMVGGPAGAATGGMIGSGIGFVGGGILGEGAVEGGDQHGREAAMWARMSSFVAAAQVGILQTKAQIAAAIIKAATAHGIDPGLALAVARVESGMNQNAVSSRGAIGIMQLMPDTARGLGVDPNNAGQNISGGVGLLAHLIAKYHDVSKALAAYNWGENHIPVAGGMPALPQETSDYIGRVERQARVIDVGGVNVYVTHPNATVQEIYAAVLRAIGEKMDKQTQRNIAQLTGSFR